MSSTLPPLPNPADQFRSRWPGDEAGFTANQMRAYGKACAAAEREAFRALVADDSAAITYQTLGQYRTALLAAIRARGET